MIECDSELLTVFQHTASIDRLSSVRIDETKSPLNHTCSYAKVPINCKGCDLVERFGFVWLLDFMAFRLTGNWPTQLSYEARRCNTYCCDVTEL